MCIAAAYIQTKKREKVETRNQWVARESRKKSTSAVILSSGFGTNMRSNNSTTLKREREREKEKEKIKRKRKRSKESELWKFLSDLHDCNSLNVFPQFNKSHSLNSK